MDDEEIYDNCTECNAHLWCRESSITGLCQECRDEADDGSFVEDLEERLEHALNSDEPGDTK